MNKQEFIEYIDKFPDDMSFTPMTVHVKGEDLSLDGMYRDIKKTIKFECTYYEDVHKLDHTHHNDESNPLAISTPFSYASDTDGVFFQDKLDKLHLTLRDILKSGKYGDVPKEWGGIPIFVLAWNLLSCLRAKEDSFYETLHPEIKEILVALGENLSNIGQDRPEFELTTECFSLKLVDLLD